MVKSVCFTGTRLGLTQAQADELANALKSLCPQICRHGDCIGADKTFHSLVRALLPKAGILVYPSNMPNLRAYCQGDVSMQPSAPIDRNHRMVEASEYILACPGERTEVLRSGTWATIRYAKKLDKPMTVMYPDGYVEHFPDIKY